MGYETAALMRADLARIETDVSALSSGLAVSPASDMYDGTHQSMSFADSMKDAIHRVDAKEHLAAEKVAAVDSGRSDDLVGAMLASQEANLSFSMLMQMRNKVMGAFDELIKLQL